MNKLLIIPLLFALIACEPQPIGQTKTKSKVNLAKVTCEVNAAELELATRRALIYKQLYCQSQRTKYQECMFASDGQITEAK